jgi:hypothetical protein
MQEVSCAVHVHSTFSDGTKTIPEIIGIAKKAGVDVLVMTDHRTLKGRREGYEGWHENLLVLFGEEINSQDMMNHYLGFGYDEEVPGSLGPKGYVAEIKKRGGFGFLAHPLERGIIYPKFHAYPWTAKDIEGYDGIEIWNWMSAFKGSVRLGNALFRVLFPHSGVKAPDPNVLAMWDRANRTRKVVALGGVDAHALFYRFLGIPFTVLPYELVLRTLRNHLLLREPLVREVAKDRQVVLACLRGGYSYIVNTALGDPKGFSFKAVSGGQAAGIGEEITLKDEAVLTVDSPGGTDIKMVRDGELVAQALARKMEFSAHQPGVYRVEVWDKDRGWIFTNPIWITKE